MPLSDLTDATAVTLALDEFDELGRDAFLNKCGFGPSRSYFVKRDDKLYDSKAIAGAAYGIQFPEQGHLPASGFNGGEIGVQRHLERLGFQMVVEGADAERNTSISSRDIALIRDSRSPARYGDFSDDERNAHERVHSALRALGAVAMDALGGSASNVLKLTFGFTPTTGVRGGKPKDLRFGVSRKQNQDAFLGNPQIFMIVSERGIEYGFSPLTRPDDFSNQDIKSKARAVAGTVFNLLPEADSPEAAELSEVLVRTVPGSRRSMAAGRRSGTCWTDGVGPAPVLRRTPSLPRTHLPLVRPTSDDAGFRHMADWLFRP